MQVFSTLAWSTVLGFGAGVGFLIGANVLGSTYNAFFGGLFSIALVLVVLPYLAFGRLAVVSTVDL